MNARAAAFAAAIFVIGFIRDSAATVSIRQGSKSFCVGEPFVSQPEDVISCSCSPTEADVNKDAQEFLTIAWAESERQLEEAAADYQKRYGDERREFQNEAYTAYTAYQLKQWETCLSKFGGEDCVNADASNRETGTNLCTFNRDTGANVDVTGDHFGPKDRCSTESCDTKVRGCRAGFDAPKCSSEKYSAAAAESTLVLSDPIGSKKDVTKVDSSSGSSADEGCVDAALLPASCRRVHASDVMAFVLCHDSLCVTPNHLVIVDGQRTSFGKHCRSKVGDESCESRRIAVNNCYWRDTASFAVGDVEVTSFDIRIPVFVTKVIQDVLMALRSLRSSMAYVALTVAVSPFLWAW
jgi:hypothetical protein